MESMVTFYQLKQIKLSCDNNFCTN